MWRYPKQEHYSGFIFKSGLTLNLLEDNRDGLNTEGITNFHFLTTLSQCERTPDLYDKKLTSYSVEEQALIRKKVKGSFDGRTLDEEKTQKRICAFSYDISWLPLTSFSGRAISATTRRGYIFLLGHTLNTIFHR